MKQILALVVLTALALLGSRRTFVAHRLRSGGQMILTGSEFIVIGLLLGDEFLNVIDQAALDHLRPFVCVILGWVGFLFGLQFERQALAKLPRGLLSISLTQAVLTMAVVAPLLWYLLSSQVSTSGPMLALAVITLAASAACTGQTTLALLTRQQRSHSRHALTLLRYISGLDPGVGLICFGVGLSLLAVHPWGEVALPSALQWLVLSLCLGCLAAWIFVSLTLTRTTQSQLVLYLIGTLALSSGIALYFQLSALFINFVCGLLVANLANVRSIRGRVMELMVGGERFLYLLLLVLAGAYWHLPALWAVKAAALYIVARLLGKLLGAYLATRRLARHHTVPPALGLGLVSQAGMALAIIVEFQLVTDDPVSRLVVSIALIGIIVNEFLAPPLVQRVTAPSDGDSP